MGQAAALQSTTHFDRSGTSCRLALLESAPPRFRGPWGPLGRHGGGQGPRSRGPKSRNQELEHQRFGRHGPGQGGRGAAVSDQEVERHRLVGVGYLHGYVCHLPQQALRALHRSPGKPTDGGCQRLLDCFWLLRPRLPHGLHLPMAEDPLGLPVMQSGVGVCEGREDCCVQSHKLSGG